MEYKFNTCIESLKILILPYSRLSNHFVGKGMVDIKPHNRTDNNKNFNRMILKKIEEALNQQINAELWSAYLYLSMSLHFEHEGRKGFANWFRIQFQEEQAHALALMDFLNARDGRVVLKPIAEVPNTWDSPLAAFQATLEHEKNVTAMINNLYAMAEQEKDFATRQKLNTFVAEQVEEEDNVRQIIDDLTLVGNDGTGLYQIDAQLATRTFVAPQL